MAGTAARWCESSCVGIPSKSGCHLPTSMQQDVDTTGFSFALEMSSASKHVYNYIPGDPTPTSTRRWPPNPLKPKSTLSGLTPVLPWQATRPLVGQVIRLRRLLLPASTFNKTLSVIMGNIHVFLRLLWSELCYVDTSTTTALTTIHRSIYSCNGR